MLGYMQFANKIQSLISLHQMMAWMRITTDLIEKPASKAVLVIILMTKHRMHFMSNCSWKNIPLTLVNYTIAKSFYYYILADYKQALAFTERSVPHHLPTLYWVFRNGRNILLSIACHPWQSN